MKKFLTIIGILCLGVSSLLAQTIQVTGTVTSADDGQPLPGVSIIVKGSSLGTVTNIEGRYSFSVPTNATLQFSFVGMATREIVATQQTIDVEMEVSALAINEVVVTALGITRDKKALGYAAQSFKGDEFANAKAINPLTAMQGKVAGMDVSSAPGAGTTQNVTIRGFSSFGNSQPLYIIDGVPLTNTQNRSGDNLNAQVDFGSGINALNPNDIADLTILKGAAATAMYGSRAANGVIMITTKSGKNTQGKMQVTYDGTVNITRIGFLPKEQELFGQGWSMDRALDENGNWGAPFDGKDRVWGNIVDNSQQLKPNIYLKNRIRDFYDLGVGTQNAISLSGGNAQTDYMLSLSQNYVNGPIPTSNDAYSRYTVGVRGSHKANNLTVSTSVNFATEKNKAIASGQGSSLWRSLFEIPTELSIVDLKDYQNNKFNTLDNYFTPYGLNPYYVINENGAEQSKQKIFGKFQLDYDLFGKVKLTYRFGGDYETSISKTHTTVVAFSEGAPNYGSSTATPGAYEQVRRERIQMNHDFWATYIDRFGDFSVNAIVGFNANERSFHELLGKISSIDIPGFYHLSNSLTPAVSIEDNWQRRLVGVFLNADIGFRDYAYLTLTARNDWSSTLPKNHNSFFYPGATFSFLLTDFLQTQNVDTKFVDFAKLRVAYGQTGNDAEPYFVYNRYLSSEITNPGYPEIDNTTFPLGGVNAYTVSNTLGNPDLKPELTNEFEIGAEMYFLNNRVGFDFSYYNRFTKGLIASIPKDPSTGYTAQQYNLGDVRNKGIELTVNLVPVKLGDFTWNLSWNYTKNKNKVEKLDVEEVYLSGFVGVGIYAKEGEALGQFKSTMAATWTDDDGVEHIIVDGVGNPLATPDMVYVGKDINEKYRMGLVNTFSWRGITLSGTLDYRYGGAIYSNTKDYMHWIGSSPESVLNNRQPFLIPNSVVDNGDGTYSENTTPVDVTALHTFYSNGGLRRDDFQIIDRSYLKLRDLSIAYQLPKKITDALRIATLRVSLNASNILLWVPSENQYIDPEITTFGNNINAKFGEFGTNPPYQIYTFGLSLTF